MEQHVAEPEHAISNHCVAASLLLHTSTTPQLLAGPGHDFSRVSTPLLCLPFEDYIVPNFEVHKIPVFDLACSSYDVTLPAAKRRCAEIERVYFDASMIIEVMGVATEDHLLPCFDIRALHRKDLRQIVVPAEHFLLLRIFRCALKTGRLINLQGMFYRHDVEDHGTVWSRLQANVESRPLIITDNDKHGLNFYVPFCGGVSGWTLAVRHLAQHGYPVRISAAADLDSKAALSYSRTHGVKMLSSAPLVSDLVAPFVATCDAADTDLWRGISLLNCNAMTLSWPCQSFSGAGSQSGWKSFAGQTFQDVLAKASQMRIGVITAENVAPVWENEDFRRGMMTRIEKAGYILIFAKVLPLQHVSPVSRRRFLAVMTHSSFHDVHPIDLAKSVAAAYFGKPRSLIQDDAWFASLPGNLLQHTYLSPELLSVYSNPDFAPGRPCTPQVAISNRKIKPSEPLPAAVVMCMYSRQHTIKCSILSEKKLLGALREENGRFRFLTALEILVSLGTTQPITLAKNLQDGCSIVGNSIAEVHAYAPLWIALQAKDLLKVGCLKSFEHLIQCFQISRLRAIPQIVQVTQDLIRFGIAGQEILSLPTTHQVRISIQIGGRFHTFNAEVGTDFATAVDAQADLNSAMLDFWRNGCTFDISTIVNFPLCLSATDRVYEHTNLEFFDEITPTLLPNVGESNMNGIRAPCENFAMATVRAGSDRTAQKSQAPPSADSSVSILRGDPGGAMPTGRSDCMLFLKLPDGKTITVDAREDHEIGYGIQLAWRHFNPLQHKIHKGHDLIQPQMHWDEYNLRPLDVIWISHRNFGGSNEPDAQLQDHWVVVPHPEMPAFVEVIRMHAAPRTLLFFPEDAPLPPGITLEGLRPQRWSAVIPIGRRHESFDHFDDWTTSPRDVAIGFLWSGNTRFMHLVPPRVHEPAAADDVAVTDDVWDDNPSPDDQLGDADDASFEGGQDGFRHVEFFDDLQETMQLDGEFGASINLFIRTPEGKTSCGRVPLNADAAYAVQCVFADYNPAEHKICKGATRILPQDAIKDHHIVSNEILTVTCRIRGGAKPQFEEEIAVHRITNFLASSEVDFFDEPHDELEIENTGSAPDHGNHSSTSSPALQIFIGTPSGTKFSVEIGDDLEIGFVIQSTWGDFNPKLHKIHKGCTRICPQETFGSYGLQRHDLISITTRSTGGAKTGDLTAKIAKTISGKDLPWDRPIANVESMLQQATTAQREELEQASSDRILVKCVRQLAKELTLDLKDFFPGAKTTKTRQTNRPTLVIGDLTFFPMTFKYADNSDVQIGSNFRISDRGLYTVPPDDFDRINQEGKLLSPNELGILSFRQPDSTCKTQTTTVTFPAMDAAGHSIIIQGWIYQYGKKQITLAQTRNKDVVLPETATITGYAFRDQWNNHESTWADLISHPAKTILNLCRCRAMTCIWRVDRQPCKPERSSSFCLWARISTQHLGVLLQRSGTTSPPVYVDLRKGREDKELPKLFQDLRILWLPKESTILDAAATFSNHHGFTFGRSGLGVRLKEDDFTAAWNQRNPGKQMPARIDIKFKWRLLGIPPQMSQAELQAALDGLNIKCRALRRQGQTWIVGAELDFDCAPFQINQRPVILERINQNEQIFRPIIAASQKPVLRQRVGEQDPLQIHDPWSRPERQNPIQQLPQGADQTLKQHQQQIIQNAKDVKSQCERQGASGSSWIYPRQNN